MSACNTVITHGETVEVNRLRELEIYDALPPAARAVVRNCVEEFALEAWARAIIKHGQARTIAALIENDAWEAAWWRMETAAGHSIKQRPEHLQPDARRAFDAQLNFLTRQAMNAVRRAA